MEEINKLVGSDTLGYLSIEHGSSWPSTASAGSAPAFTGTPWSPPTETMDIVYDKPLSQSNSNKKL